VEKKKLLQIDSYLLPLGFSVLHGHYIFSNDNNNNNKKNDLNFKKNNTINKIFKDLKILNLAGSLFFFYFYFLFFFIYF
jgi:hypothetical protein